MLRHKLSGEGYTPEHFRVGMTLTCDPTPFLLAAGATKVPAPDTGGGNLLTNVQGRRPGRARGRRSCCGCTCPAGAACSSCIWTAPATRTNAGIFGLIDEVMPADASEWGAWLDPAEGMIGWPEFQTKDGKIYGRAWAPGPGRIPPGVLPETIETTRGHADPHQPGHALRCPDRPGAARAADRIHPGGRGGGRAAGLGADLGRHRHQPRDALAHLTSIAAGTAMNSIFADPRHRPAGAAEPVRRDAGAAGPGQRLLHGGDAVPGAAS